MEFFTHLGINIFFLILFNSLPVSFLNLAILEVVAPLKSTFYTFFFPLLLFHELNSFSDFHMELCLKMISCASPSNSIYDIKKFLIKDVDFRIISSDWGLADWAQKLIGANK